MADTHDLLIEIGTEGTAAQGVAQSVPGVRARHRRGAGKAGLAGGALCRFATRAVWRCESIDYRAAARPSARTTWPGAGRRLRSRWPTHQGRRRFRPLLRRDRRRTANGRKPIRARGWCMSIPSRARRPPI